MRLINKKIKFPVQPIRALFACVITLGVDVGCKPSEKANPHRAGDSLPAPDKPNPAEEQNTETPPQRRAPTCFSIADSELGNSEKLQLAKAEIRAFLSSDGFGQAVRVVLSIKADKLRLILLQHLVESPMSVEEIPERFDVLAKSLPEKVIGSVLGEFLGLTAKLDFQLALNLYAKMPRKGDYQWAVGSIIDKCSRSDFLDALAWSHELSAGDARVRPLSSIYNKISSAPGRFYESKAERDRIFQGIFSPDYVDTISRAIGSTLGRSNHFESVIPFIQNLPDAARLPALKAALEEISARESVNLIGTLNSYQFPNELINPIASVMATAALERPDKLGEDLLKISNAEVRAAALDFFSASWLDQSPRQASEWITGLPSSDGKQRAIVNLVKHATHEHDYAGAAEWIKLVEDPQVRESLGKLLPSKNR